jgi:hypothetical protein
MIGKLCLTDGGKDFAPEVFASVYQGVLRQQVSDAGPVIIADRRLIWAGSHTLPAEKFARLEPAGAGDRSVGA